MSRASPTDVGLTSAVRVDRAGTIAGFSDLHVVIGSAEHTCPQCGRAMTRHGSYNKHMAHVAGEAPCTLTAEASRHRCKRCGTAEGADIPFASMASPAINDVLEERIIKLLRRRQTIAEAARARNVSHDTVRLVINGVHTRRPKLTSILLADEIHAEGYREMDAGKQICVFWACAYDGATGHLIDVVESGDATDMDKWLGQFEHEERRRVAFFCSDMHDICLSAAKKWCELACIGVGRFRVAKIGVEHMDNARRHLQKGASNGADIKRRAHKLAVNRGKRRRDYGSVPWIEIEEKTICNVLSPCDSKHSLLRQANMTLQFHCIRQDYPWADRHACERALESWTQKASGLAILEMRRFAKTISRYRQHLTTATITHIDTTRAESANDKTKEPKRKSHGFGGFEEIRRRLLLAFGAPDAVEGAMAYAKRKKRQAEVFASKRKRKKR